MILSPKIHDDSRCPVVSVSLRVRMFVCAGCILKLLLPLREVVQ